MDKELKFLIDLIGERLVKEDILESKHFKEIYDAIALENDDKLSRDAKELKEKLLKLKPLVKNDFTQKQILDMDDSQQEEAGEIICKNLRESIELGGGFGILKDEFSKNFIDEFEEDRIVDSLILEDHLKGY